MIHITSNEPTVIVVRLTIVRVTFVRQRYLFGPFARKSGLAGGKNRPAATLLGFDDTDIVYSIRSQAYHSPTHD